MSDTPIRNREVMARQRRVGRLLFLLDLARTASSGETALSPVELLRSKDEWRRAGMSPGARWTKLCEGDPVFRRRPPSAMTCQLADDALDGQLQILSMLDAHAADVAAQSS